MQAKDLDDKVILKCLAQFQGQWCTWGEKEYCDPKTGMPYMPNIQLKTYPQSVVPTKVFLAKMRSLMKRKLVGGCPCGCRGDYEITDKGLELIGEKRIKPYSGYGA